MADEAGGYDLQLATRHTYLGDIEDVETTGSEVGIETGHRCLLPFLAIPGVVVFPGATIPLRLVDREQLASARSAMRARPSHHGLMVVGLRNVMTAKHIREGKMVACTIKIRQICVLDDGTINCVATGLQRCRILSSVNDQLAEVEFLSEDELAPVARAVREEHAYWGSWAYKTFDPGSLAHLARTAYATIAPEVQLAQGDPRTLAYWLATNAPLHHSQRQRLLAMGSTSERLRFLVKLLREMQDLCCRNCVAPVASTQDMLAMSEAGSGGVFVNLYGYAHDVVTLRHTRRLVLEGRPETEQSWFPGYAWTIARCGSCFLHLGWRFTAVREDLSPRSFWGLRPQCLRSLRQGEMPALAVQRHMIDEQEDFL